MLPEKVTIVEVGPRDGLQNEKKNISLDNKVKLINLLSDAGFSIIESGSIVSKDKIPQMQDTLDVLKKVNTRNNLKHQVLIPNIKGLDKLLEHNSEVNKYNNNHIDTIAVFTAASETFCSKNINKTIDESLNEYKKVIDKALRNNIKVRGYISCCFGCPYEGDIKFEKVLDVAKKLSEMGCYEISIADTIGVASAGNVQEMLFYISKSMNLNKFSVHFHDTYGQALANVYAALLMGISVIDSSIGGLGGCPYAGYASGNLATEDLLFLLNNLKIKSNVDFNKLLLASDFIKNDLDIPIRSKVYNAIKAKEKHELQRCNV